MYMTPTQRRDAWLETHGDRKPLAGKPFVHILDAVGYFDEPREVDQPRHVSVIRDDYDDDLDVATFSRFFQVGVGS